MKEKPILYSAPMVNAILAGRKTQTRRIMNPQPEPMDDGKHWWRCRADRMMVGVEDELRGVPGMAASFCPYGDIGHRLWVKETHRYPASADHLSPKQIAAACLDAGYKLPWAPIRYEADGGTVHRESLNPGEAWGKTRVSIHMTKWAARILLELTDVRVERLQHMTERDAIAEGFEPDVGHGLTAVGKFSLLWDEINGAGSWYASPWVWVLGFRVVSIAGRQAA